MKNSRKALKTIYLQVTKQNYDENKLLKTDYITYLYAKKFNISRALLAFF